MSREIAIHHLTRVEGHGNLTVTLDQDNRVADCRLDIVEAPRFFEAMLKGRSWQYIHHITSRICGICSIGHQLASIQATERAMGVEVSEQTVLLRRLALHAENIQSHMLHLGYLVLPDLTGVNSLIDLARIKRPQALPFISMHRMGNELSRLVCGRTTHPQRLIPGGFTKPPLASELEGQRNRLLTRMQQAMEICRFFARLKEQFPDLERPAPGLALRSDGLYALLEGELAASGGSTWTPADYLQAVEEYVTPQSTSKWARLEGQSYRVGALARLNENHERLGKRALKAMEIMGLQAPLTNPFLNNLAQMVEVIHAMEDSMALIDTLLERGVKDEAPVKVKPGPGHGVGAVEVPRGLLIHEYVYDERGLIERANCVIPTGQNLACLQEDLSALAPTLSGQDDEAIAKTLSMLVRAYDPCISCATHLITGEPGDTPHRGVRFVRIKD